MEFEPERFGGLEVDHQLEFGGLQNRQIGRLFALENAPSRHFDRVEQIMLQAERVVTTVVKSREPFSSKRI
jgi:hypothetical protein